MMHVQQRRVKSETSAMSWYPSRRNRSRSAAPRSGSAVTARTGCGGGVGSAARGGDTDAWNARWSLPKSMPCELQTYCLSVDAVESWRSWEGRQK